MLAYIIYYNYNQTIIGKYYTDEWGKVIRLSSGWHQIDNRFIYFNSDGTVKSLYGLQTISGSKYLLDENGVIQTGLQTISGKEYYFGADGKMQTGWQTVSEKKYYFGIRWHHENGLANDIREDVLF